MKILVTGATGYIGGRLIPELLNEGHEVRAFVRDPDRVRGKKWFSQVEVFQGDLGDYSSVDKAVKGMDAAYFLVHAMYSGGDFAERERDYAENFAQSAAELKHVIYLGGLLPEGRNVSDHLKSRSEVGRILRGNGNVTEFRAGPIIGSGSASFEMVRYLTERLPIMVVPRWVHNDVQPIGVRDVIQYLVAALTKGPLGIVDIGGDVLSFKGMMETFAQVRGLKRVMIPVPVLTPLLSGIWVGLITPVPNSLAIPLVQGIIDPVVANTDKAEASFPAIKPLPYRESVRRAIQKSTDKATETRWADSLGYGDFYKLTDEEGLIQEVRTVTTDASPRSIFRSFTSIGGEKGWLTWNWAWKLRGWMDWMIGGPGLKRGRRHPSDLRVGDALDFWRVEALEQDRFLLLRAEMTVPGKAWLKFEVLPKRGGTQFVQSALFAPKGLIGWLYWYGLYPVHQLLFGRMAARIVQAGEAFENDHVNIPETV
jgi:uncharacterized protein YbjT (DUF2867 family)